MVSGEAVPPYDRPPLSKDVLTGKRDDTTLPFDTERLGVDLRLGTHATGLSTADRVLTPTRATSPTTPSPSPPAPSPSGSPATGRS